MTLSVALSHVRAKEGLDVGDSQFPFAFNANPHGLRGADHAESGELRYFRTLGVIGGVEEGGENCDVGVLGVGSPFSYYEPSEVLGVICRKVSGRGAVVFDGGGVGWVKKC